MFTEIVGIGTTTTTKQLRETTEPLDACSTAVQLQSHQTSRLPVTTLLSVAVELPEGPNLSLCSYLNTNRAPLPLNSWLVKAEHPSNTFSQIPLSTIIFDRLRVEGIFMMFQVKSIDHF